MFFIIYQIFLDTITINKKNKKIRFRAIHAGKHDAVLLKFQEHFLRVIASDGIDFKHHIDVDGIYLTPGERYDFELKTTSVLQKYDIQMEKENEKGLVSSTQIFIRSFLTFRRWNFERI